MRAGEIADELPPTDAAAVRARRVEAEALPRADQAAGAGLGGQRLRLARASSTSSTSSSSSSTSLGAALRDLAPPPASAALGDIGDWWTEPIVFQKFAVWTLLWEVLGLGCGSMPLTLPLQAADRRRPLLAAAGHGAAAAVARQGAAHPRDPPDAGRRRRSTPACSPPASSCSSRRDRHGGTAAGRLRRRDRGPARACWALLGLRDKVSFLAARPELYGPMLVISLFRARQPGSSAGSSSSSSSGGAPRPRS